MFQRILVPLDGSEHAESALPVAENIARTTGGELVFVRVVPFHHDGSSATTERQAATEYLARQRHIFERKGRIVRTRLLEGAPVRHILACCEIETIDLIVMCSQGETGLRSRVFGSVAHKILRQSRIPVLILREAAGSLSNQHPSGHRSVRILVALNGFSLAEKALLPALALSSALSFPERALLHLVHVFPLPEALDIPEQGHAASLLDIAAAQAYLRMVEISLLDHPPEGKECTLQASVVGERDITSGIIRAAEDGLPARDGQAARPACDVIALTTHGRRGLEGWGMGSIAEHLLDETRLPLLVIPSSYAPEHSQQKMKETSAIKLLSTITLVLAPLYVFLHLPH